MSSPSVYVVVPVFNRKEKTLRFLDAFKAVDYLNTHLVITDDGSTDGTALAIAELHPEVKVLEGTGNLWWTGGTNLGVQYALSKNADYILTINDDCVMQSDFLSKMVAISMAHHKSIVGCRIMSDNEREKVWSLGATLKIFKRGLYILNHHEAKWSEIKGTLSNPLPVQSMPGNGVLIPSQAFLDVGLYDEKSFPHYHADSEFTMRAAQKGYLLLISLESVIYNHIPEMGWNGRRRDLILHRRSTLYWKAMKGLIDQHAPFGIRWLLLVRQYAPFYLPAWSHKAAKWIYRLVS